MRNTELLPEDERLHDTRRAFDSVAADYDGPAGNNVVVQRMRSQMWQLLTLTFPPGARLLDLGCGTGIDAAYLAGCGYSVLATDWSPAMVSRTQARIEQNGVKERASARVLGIHELRQLQGEQFDGMYSDLGALNCAPNLYHTSRVCWDLLRPGGSIVASVIGRICPWEMAYYAAHASWKRAFVRWTDGTVPVSLNRETVWMRYFTPRRFYDAFAEDFDLNFYRGLRICSPPPYLFGPTYRRLLPICRLGEWIDDHIGALPIVRDAGDHFLMVLTRRS
jgi:2-polyprenyl-3-methyl-5-hydroxy-6-metoxy-1,4-benzoquinol methylase